MRKLLFLTISILLSVHSQAQQDPEYLMEVGVGGGMMNYLGDFNGSVAKGHQPSASFVVRRLFNPYMALRAGVTYGKLKGDSKNVTTYYPGLNQTPYSFDHSLIDVGVVYEYNFWPYGTGRDYRGAKRLTPYVFGGFGTTYAKLPEESVFTANIPLGVGIKYKMSERVNLGVEWRVHFSLSDKLDGRKDPYDIISSGAFKNTDGYSGLQVTITYSFMTKCKTCHNDND